VAAALMAARSAPLRPLEGAVAGVAALAWGECEIEVLLANLLPGERRLVVELPGAGSVTTASLPSWGGAREEWRVADGLLELRLGPYETLKLTACR
jgi:hypothetical protein